MRCDAVIGITFHDPKNPSGRQELEECTKLLENKYKLRPGVIYRGAVGEQK